MGLAVGLPSDDVLFPEHLEHAYQRRQVHDAEIKGQVKDLLPDASLFRKVSEEGQGIKQDLAKKCCIIEPGRSKQGSVGSKSHYCEHRDKPSYELMRDELE